MRGHEAGTAMPCIPRFIKGRQAWPCERFEIMSQAEAEEESDRDIAVMNRVAVAHAAAKADAEARGLRKGTGGTGEMPCPCCKDGLLRYSVASYNGHMHAKCSTEDCVSWME